MTGSLRTTRDYWLLEKLTSYPGGTVNELVQMQGGIGELGYGSPCYTIRHVIVCFSTSRVHFPLDELILRDPHIDELFN